MLVRSNELSRSQRRRGLSLTELVTVVAIMTIVGFTMVLIVQRMAVSNLNTLAMSRAMAELQPLYEAFAALVRQSSSDTDAGQAALDIVNGGTQLDVYILTDPTDASSRTLLGRIYRETSTGNVVVQRVRAPISSVVYVRKSMLLRFDLGPAGVKGPADYGPWKLGQNKKSVLMTIQLNVDGSPFEHKLLVAGPNIRAEN